MSRVLPLKPEYASYPPSLGSFAHELTMRDGRTIAVNYWLRQGDAEKPALVILPGLDEQALSWWKVLNILEDANEDSTILIINQRGQGATRESELERYISVPHYVPRVDQIHILKEIIEDLELQKMVLVGHSYGGSTALGAISTPDLRSKIQSVALLAPHVTHFERFTSNRVLQMQLQAAAWLELWNPLAYELGTAAYLPVFFEKALREGNLCPFTPDWDLDRRNFLSAMSLGLLHVDTQADIASLVHDPRPVHLMVAETDRLIPRAAHEYLYELIPASSRGQWLEPHGSTHRLHQKASLQIAQLLMELTQTNEQVLT